jgi:hypothetical protein
VVSAYTMFMRSQGTHRCPLRAPSPFLYAVATHRRRRAMSPRG